MLRALPHLEAPKLLLHLEKVAAMRRKLPEARRPVLTLLSMQIYYYNNFDIHISKGVLTVADAKGQLIGTASKTKSNLHKLDEFIAQRGDVEESEVAAFKGGEGPDWWHQLCDHLGAHNADQLQSQRHNTVDGLHISLNPQLILCEKHALGHGKHSKSSFCKSELRRASEVLKLGDTKLNGLMTEVYMFFVRMLRCMLLICDFSRYILSYLLKHSSDVLRCLELSIRHAERRIEGVLKYEESEHSGGCIFKGSGLYCEKFEPVHKSIDAYTSKSDISDGTRRTGDVQGSTVLQSTDDASPPYVPVPSLSSPLADLWAVIPPLQTE